MASFAEDMSYLFLLLSCHALRPCSLNQSGSVNFVLPNKRLFSLWKQKLHSIVVLSHFFPLGWICLLIVSVVTLGFLENSCFFVNNTSTTHSRCQFLTASNMCLVSFVGVCKCRSRLFFPLWAPDKCCWGIRANKNSQRIQGKHFQDQGLDMQKRMCTKAYYLPRNEGTSQRISNCFNF